jgi:poly-gamma-glutamate capsule biosynthesis protein CapA/YwtB (metallophosphatase superfamily)
MNDFSRRDFLLTTGQFAIASAISPYARVLDSGTGDFAVAAVGDCMIARQISNLPPDEFLPVAKIIQSADVSFGNFEMTLAEDDAPPAYHDSCAYVHLRADLPGNRAIAEELKWAGFKMLGMANNHAMDYGEPGLLSTTSKIEDAGLVHAGTGRTLAEARSPAYYDSPKGRIALVACASTFPYGAFAADGNGEVAPRAGISPCRIQTTYQLTSDQLKSLRAVAASLGLNPGSSDAAFTFLTHKFVTGAANEVLTAADPLDLAALTSEVRRASRNADLTLFGIHAHEGARSAEIPAQFLQPLAHACIDAGANAFIGHGPHVLRGIEIYKRRPIFYSLGNFIFHGESAKQIPPEIYETCSATGSDPSDVFDKVLQGFSAEAYWNSVVALPTFRDGRLAELKLYPIVLQSELSRPRRGTPVLADADAGRKIIAKLSQLSEPYGTRISYEGGVGVVQL